MEHHQTMHLPAALSQWVDHEGRAEGSAWQNLCPRWKFPLTLLVGKAAESPLQSYP